MDLDKARGIAGRIWCDLNMRGEVMDPELAEIIARLLAIRVAPDVVLETSTGTGTG